MDEISRQFNTSFEHWDIHLTPWKIAGEMTREGSMCLQPLRIPTGWEVQWNIFSELEPTPENVAGKFFGGDALFYASNTVRMDWCSSCSS